MFSLRPTRYPPQCCSGRVPLLSPAASAFDVPAPLWNPVSFKGSAVTFSTGRIEGMSSEHVWFPVCWLSLPLCDAAVSVRWSSPYKYSSWLMDPAAAVCCSMEHGHIMYTQIQMVQKHMRGVCCCSRSISQAVRECRHWPKNILIFFSSIISFAFIQIYVEQTV